MPLPAQSVCDRGKVWSNFVGEGAAMPASLPVILGSGVIFGLGGLWGGTFMFKEIILDANGIIPSLHFMILHGFRNRELRMRL